MGKRFTSVAEMVRHTSPDGELAGDFEKQLEQRQVVRALMVLRAARGLKQSDIAGRIGCTQSRISKLEASADDDLSLCDLASYAKALGLCVEITLMKEGATNAERARYHTGLATRLLDGHGKARPAKAKGEQPRLTIDYSDALGETAKGEKKAVPVG